MEGVADDGNVPQRSRIAAETVDEYEDGEVLWQQVLELMNEIIQSFADKQ